MSRHLLSIRDLTKREIEAVLALTARCSVRPGGFRRALAGRNVVLIFDKQSTRTRLAFEVACDRLGANAVTMKGADMQIGRGESYEDSGRIFSRFVDAVCWRTNEQDRLTRLAAASKVPVINMLSDLEHPCQILADLFTIRRRMKGRGFPPVAFIGDAANNVAHSWLMAAARLGMDLRLACPKGYEPDQAILSNALEEASRTGARILVTADPAEAVRGSRVLYTDVWVSMGQEEERGRRLADFKGYQINGELLGGAMPGAIVMHCLPAHRGEEITDEMMDGPASVVFDQAEARLYNAMAVLVWCIGGGRKGGARK